MTPGAPVVAPDVRHQGRGTTAYQTRCAVSCPPEAPLDCLVDPCSLLPQLCGLRHKLEHLPPCQGLPGRPIRIMRRHAGDMAPCPCKATDPTTVCFSSAGTSHKRIEYNGAYRQ